MEKGCNGKCFRGVWCECKEADYFEKEHRKELFKAGIAAYTLSLIISAIVYFVIKLFQ